MTPTQFRAALTALGLTQTGAAAALRVDARTVRRWASGERPVPGTVERLLEMMERERIAAAIEQPIDAPVVVCWEQGADGHYWPVYEGTE